MVMLSKKSYGPSTLERQGLLPVVLISTIDLFDHSVSFSRTYLSTVFNFIAWPCLNSLSQKDPLF